MGRWRDALGRSSDMFFAIAVLVIVSLMIVPVGTTLMDFLIASNITLAVVTLLVALYAQSAIKLPSFPTLLLLATLFRLALNVSTTKLILLEANAGSIIQSFGEFVVGGNFVVGAVVFLVLVLIQFIVIAKGSERVAEVGARFTLDAMPGKQMSIDADLRGGLINEGQARERRELLERESKLYGAMDGAMKFVKGDAIAGIVISAVNIVGGLVIGMMQRDMGFGEAAETYSLLTIGDGLVSQIPALLLSVSAGIVVTRVAGAEKQGQPTRLAEDMVAQFLAQPKVLAIACGMLLLFAATSGVTGFPPIPFALLGVGAGVLALRRTRQTARDQEASPTEEESSSSPGNGTPGEARRGRFTPHGLVLEVEELSAGIFGVLGDDGWRLHDEVEHLLKLVVQSESESLGIPLPAIRCHLAKPGMELATYGLIGHGLLLARGEELQPGRVFVVCRPDEHAGLLEAGVPAEAVRRDPATGEFAVHLLPGTHVQGVYVFEEERERLEAFVTLTPIQVVCQHLRHAIRQNASELLRSAELATMLDEIGESYLSLLGERGVVSRHRLLEILRDLLGSLVPVRNLPEILSALNRLYQAYGPEPFARLQPAELMTQLRLVLRRLLMESCCGAKRRIRFYHLDEDADALLAQYPRLRYEDESALRQMIREQVDANAFFDPQDPMPSPYPVLLSGHRAALREVLREEFPDVITLTRQELDARYYELEYSMLGALSLAPPQRDVA